MLRNKIKKKIRAGLTLLELLIAVTVLGVGIAGVFTVFTVGFNASIRANDISMAGIEAQLQMERLMGRPWFVEPAMLPAPMAPLSSFPPLSSVDSGIEWGEVFESNGFWIRLEFEGVSASGGHCARNMGAGLPVANVKNVAPGSGCVAGCNGCAPLDGSPACPTCPLQELMLVEVTIFVYVHDPDGDADAIANGWTITHKGILNVNGRII